MKNFLASLAILFIAISASAESVKTVYNPFTSKLDYITKVDTNTIVAGTGIQTSYSNGKLTVTASGGSAAAGGSDTQVQYNSSNVLAGSPSFTFVGTTVTVSGDVVVSSQITVGQGFSSPRPSLIVKADDTQDALQFQETAFVGNYVRVGFYGGSSLIRLGGWEFSRSGGAGHLVGFNVQDGSNTNLLNVNWSTGQTNVLGAPGLVVTYGVSAGSATIGGDVAVNGGTTTLTGPVIMSSAPVMTATRSDTIAFPGGQVQSTPYHPSSNFFTKIEESILDNQDSRFSYTKGAAGTLSTDTTDVIRSTASLKLGSDGAATAIVAKRTSISPTIDFTGKQIVLYFKIDGIANMAEGSLYLSSDNLASNFYIFDWAAAGSSEQFKYWQEGEWARITLNFGEASVTGAPNRAAINSWQLRIKDKGVAASTVTVHWNGIGTIPEPPQGIISITDDDGFTAAVSTMAHYMDRYGYRGTAYIEPDNQSVGNFMSTGTIVQLESLHGWELGLHPTVTTLTTASTGTIDYTYYVNKIWMVNSGIARYLDGMAYPHGGFNTTVEAETRKYFTYGRTIVTGPSNANPYLETYPPANPYRLRSISVSSTTTQQQLYNWASRASTNHEWLILTFHDFPVPQVAATDISPTTFQVFIDTVNQLGLRVEPIGEVLRNLPAVIVVSSANVTGQLQVGTLALVDGSSIAVSGAYLSSKTVTTDEYANGNSSTAQTINWNNGNKQSSTLTGSVTYTFIPPPHSCALTLRVATGAGSFTATWPGAVLWSAGTAPTITATASKNDICTFFYSDQTGKYYGSCIQNF